METIYFTIYRHIGESINMVVIFFGVQPGAGNTTIENVLAI